MAFTTTFKSVKTGQSSDSFNIDFSVGPGAHGNRPVDIMLVQALFRIVHFEVETPLLPPPGHTGIEVDGILGPATARFIIHFQQTQKAQGTPTLIDGILDPFRAQGKLSTIAKVRYALESMNDTAFFICKQQGIDNYTALPKRDDVPQALRSELAQRRDVAKKYQK